MPSLHITTATGETKELQAATGITLMEALQAEGLVEGTCGGAASCGTCHVYFTNKEIAGEQTEDEGYMLEGLEGFVDIREGSRLSCQLKVTDAHDGLKIEIAPEA
ncbi:2Fe-2S iron-sulfur cluster-binding protein [Hellea balneolensis]|uniref:2Fe-2S iron-sulfur cluster-binding protein n=1 Tax=Hellea balneolensis TaxID=287478 RepID=UPI0004154BCE|nr:2Fe-2S iron-sulfur cluster-binding protein [Hellea balneolensis]